MTRMWMSVLFIGFVAGAISVTPASTRAEPYVLLGLYPHGSLQVDVPEIQEVDAWLAPTGRRFAIAANFMGLEFPNAWWNVPAELNGAWNAGYLPFVNLTAERTPKQIASGLIDGAITTFAEHFATWAAGGKKAFIAPLPEMNGDWVLYHGDPGDFIAAYLRIRAIFSAALRAKNVPENAISWVFVPNGWSLPGDEFERFYPGHANVDIVGFSAYNYGGCVPTTPWAIWGTFDTVFKPYLDRMSIMAPGKPIFITQTGVLEKPVNGVGDKNVWFQDSYTRLAAYPRLRGILYFNYVLPPAPNLPNCANADFRLHIPGTAQWQGFKAAVANPSSNFGYWAPGSSAVSQIVFAPSPTSIFADVLRIHPFAAEAGDVDYSEWIDTLYRWGVTGGCATNPLRFCPGEAVTRGQMAVFLLRAIHGAGYRPPAATGNVFDDVPSTHPLGNWIETLARDGITAGCNDGNYCPDKAVTRAEMAVFLLRGKHGAGYAPPSNGGVSFADVPPGHPFERWIEQLAAEGITAGCTASQYCPDVVVTRQQMAVFLVRAFDL